MTSTALPDNAFELDLTADYSALAARFRPVFDRIRAGAVQRERDRVLPFEQIGWLKEAGFGAVRLPVSSGGAGASIADLTRLLIELSAADSNIPQALRGHFAFAEDRLVAAAGVERDRWWSRFAAGELAGNAWSEIGDVALGETNTKVAHVITEELPKMTKAIERSGYLKARRKEAEKAAAASARVITSVSPSGDQPVIARKLKSASGR